MPRFYKIAEVISEQVLNGSVTGELVGLRDAFYEDVVVLAFETPEGGKRIADVDEKALYYRAPFTSAQGVKPFLPTMTFEDLGSRLAVVRSNQIVDITEYLQPDGVLKWNVPDGDWTVMRFGRRNTGATTRPAPDPVFGFECDKLDGEALDAHLDAYVGKLLKKVGPRKQGCGWTMLHIDSWEMGSQNWTSAFAQEFQKRRGYDPTPYLPAYTGLIVDSEEKSERFLWDIRQTVQQLVLENHAERLQQFAHHHGMGLSIEPYDMNPTSDLELGVIADVPMCEFWSPGGFDSTYSCFEATSVAHTMGRPVVAAEAFTDGSSKAWEQHPGSMKNQGDWAFCNGINRFVYHTFAHKTNERLPGMTMGPYGVHWDRGQTWWPMVDGYHRYVARCQSLLQQGQTVADILYLIPEGAPHVFQPPASALEGKGLLRERRGYNFDGCAPSTLISRGSVENGRVVFPGGAAYELLVLPACDTMTPELLQKISSLVEAGATVVGSPPSRSPSLVDFPICDQQVHAIATQVWGTPPFGSGLVERKFGKGNVIWENVVDAKRYQQPLTRPITDALWIWYPEEYSGLVAEPCTRYFQCVFTVNADQPIESAQIEATADNDFQLSINESPVLSGENFNLIYRDEVSSLVKPGKNVITVKAINTGEHPNPAGLIACLNIQYRDGSEQSITTDENWQSSRQFPSSDWVNAKQLGNVDMTPWHLNLSASDSLAELYPNYRMTSDLLAKKGVQPDFESNGPIRYTHRHADSFDLYFVSNRNEEVVDAECVFRIEGRQPQRWDPLDGSTHTLPQYSSKAGRTTIPIRFEPHQSFFILFGDADVPLQPIATQNLVTYQTVASLEGSWNVDFDVGLGGPADVTFDGLTQWNQNSREGIKHYSGIATYRKTFDLPSSVQSNEHPIWLDLGTVHNIARVRLNGNDMGVLWCAPWRVDISSAVQPEGNLLEIEIANLWRNRLIGDRMLEPDEQVTWTTYNPYESTSPLLPSGLLGPVEIVIPKIK
ncbi:hypothetical protein FHS27_006560 [Rhodopirellula rubra]|uniref:Beta-mannosidase-like galactose-binding domain-containing protein n=1 Tax=Aporhodopirellula rubra TaxID=980271 RepID=A0A7W5H8I0_9BACT|nr:glycosyl hydrolase [Aporhodopirellula rubra]MBB3210712.1 hypothetical protein [Aporhodopirellula rubra]